MFAGFCGNFPALDSSRGLRMDRGLQRDERERASVSQDTVRQHIYLYEIPG